MPLINPIFCTQNMKIQEILMKEIRRSYPLNCSIDTLYLACRPHKQGTVDRELRKLRAAGLIFKVDNQKHQIQYYGYIPQGQPALFNSPFNYQEYAN